MSEAQTPRQQIVIAKVEMTGFVPTSQLERFDGINWRPRLVPAPEAKAALWLRRGTAADVGKAQKANPGWAVLTYPTTERDPLGRARAEVLARHAATQQLSRAGWGTR